MTGLDREMGDQCVQRTMGGSHPIPFLLGYNVFVFFNVSFYVDV